MSQQELIERLAEADRIRATPRRTTSEWRPIGHRILSNGRVDLNDPTTVALLAADALDLAGAVEREVATPVSS